MKKDFYFLHIPKTGGIYLTLELTKLLPGLLPDNMGHRYWYFGDNYKDKYIISSFRDPIKRLISHFAFSVTIINLLTKKENFTPSQYLKEKIFHEVNIDNFREWIKDWGEYTSNFQTKNILYSDTDKPFIGFHEKNIDFENIIIDKNKLFSRLNHIEILLTTDQLNPNTIKKIANKIQYDLQFKPKTISFKLNDMLNSFTGNNYNINKESAKLYSQLTQKDFDYLKKLNNIDYEIYNDQSLFWNGGK